MTNDERLERLIRLDDALELFQSRYLPHREEQRERFDQHDWRQQDRKQRQRVERR